MLPSMVIVERAIDIDTNHPYDPEKSLKVMVEFVTDFGVWLN